MKHRAALAGALAAGLFALMAGRGSSATVGILASVDAGCCWIFSGSNLQNDPAGTAEAPSLPDLQRSNGEPIASVGDRPSVSGDPVTVNEVANDGSEKAGDSLGSMAMALKYSGELDGNSPDAVSSIAAPEPSVLTRLLMVFADLRATVFGGP